MNSIRFGLLVTTTFLALSASSRAGDIPSTDTAQYRVTFDATWSSQNHPTQFPSSAHFSGLIGGTHDSSVSFWGPGQIASPGIKSMAETGSKFPLTNEVNSAIFGGSAENLLSGGGIGTSPNATSFTFSISRDYPLVTLVSMIAPSPDWFVGVHGQNLLDNGLWVDDLTVQLPPYDAGTDSGVSFGSGNQPTNPVEPIAQITGFPFSGTPPLGTFRFERIDTPNPGFQDLGFGLAGTTGVPSLQANSTLKPGAPITLSLSNALPGGSSLLVVGTSQVNQSVLGGTFVPAPNTLVFGLPINAAGEQNLAGSWPSGLPSGTPFFFQHWIMDPGAIFGASASNAVCATTP